MTMSTLVRGRLVSVAACAVMSVAAAGACPPQTSEPLDREAALRLLNERIGAYAALHRRLEGPLPPLTSHRDMAWNYLSRQLLANAIRKAQPRAQQGNIFTTEVAALFRTTIAGALRGRDVEAFLAELQWEHPHLERLSLAVNEPLPEGASHEVRPCCSGRSRRCRKTSSTES